MEMKSTMSTQAAPSVVVISGGTAANSLVSAFQSLAGSSSLTYVLPIRYASTNSNLTVVIMVGLRPRLVALLVDRESAIFVLV